MSVYSLSLQIHIACAALSFIFFIIRGIWMIGESDLLTAKFTRVAPHVIDTVLLSAAIVLMLQINQYPLAHSWLTVKLGALILYILLGTIALKRGKTKRQRIMAFVSALTTFLFIVSVAHFHHPSGALLFLN